MKFDIKSFITGVVTGAVAIMVIEVVRGAIIKKKAPSNETTPEEYQEMLNHINNEDSEASNDYESDLASKMMNEKKSQYNKYEEEAKKYHNVLNAYDIIDEDAAALEHIEEYNDYEEEEELNKYKDINKNCYFIMPEDASNDGLNDLVDCIFCADGVLVKTDTEEILDIKALFSPDIELSDIYRKFNMENYEPIFIRSDKTGMDYSVEWIDQSYKEAFA